MRTALLLLALSCLPASAAKRTVKVKIPVTDSTEILMGDSLATPEIIAGQKRLDEAGEKLEALTKEIQPFLDRLQALTDEYGRGKNLESLFQQREALNSEFGGRFEKLDILREEFDRLCHNVSMAKLDMGFGQFMAGRGIPQNAGKDIAQAQTCLSASQRHAQFRERLRTVRAAEQTAYVGAANIVASRKNTRIGAAVVAAVLLVSGIAALVLRRRKGVKTVQASPLQTGQHATGGPPAALPPPGTPALEGPAAAGPPVAVGPGTVLGENYRLDRELGRGGMGVVYEATDLALSRKVAIKRMHEAISQDGKELEMFMSEARLVAQLKHPNIVEIYSILREKGQTYLIFEYVAGTPLSAFLRGRRLPMKSVKPAIKQIGAALDYAHSRKVIHRDLKPSNVVVTPQGIAKVMDFGIAHQASMTVARLTRTQGWGTPPYMAPEQELGRVSREADIFSLGVCLYEMIVGRLPYTGPNFLAQKQGKLYVPPSKAVPGIAPEADAVLAKALDPDPAQRYHSGKELCAAVESLPEPKAA